MNPDHVQSIPFVNLSRQFQSLANELLPAMTDVLASGEYILSERVALFEAQLAQFCGSHYAIGVASGSDALLLGLLALGIQPGDEVITTPLTYIATAAAICRAGATPVFADVDPGTYTLSAREVARKLTPRTRAIIPVHLFGMPADLDPILELANEYGLDILEDAAQAIGTEYGGAKVGSVGRAGALSFFPTKLLGAAGDGGAVLTNDEEVWSLVHSLRRQGASRPDHYQRIGLNSRLDSLQAALLSVKLRYLPKWIERRRGLATSYVDMLSGLGLRLPVESPGNRHSYSQFTIGVPKGRDSLQVHLAERGIETKVYYRSCLHRQPAFAYLARPAYHYPVSERLSNELLSLPCYPELSDYEQSTIVRSIESWVSSNNPLPSSSNKVSD